LAGASTSEGTTKVATPELFRVAVPMTELPDRNETVPEGTPPNFAVTVDVSTSVFP